MLSLMFHTFRYTEKKNHFQGANEVFHAEFEIIRSGNEIKYIEVTCYCNGSLCNAKGKEKVSILESKLISL